MATPPINPPGPGPRPGAATGTRPGTGVTQDGRYVGGRLTVVISELQKLNGRNGIQKSNRHLEKIDSNIKDLLDFFVQQQRQALAATSQTPTQTGQQQGGQNQSSQRNQNQKTQQNQKNQQSGGIGSNLLNFLKTPAGAVTAGVGSVLGFPLIAATLKTLFNPKTVRGRAAIGVIGFAMADKIVDYLLGPKGESELRDEVDKIFNPEAALGFGFLGNIINRRLGALFFVAGLFATNKNIEKFDNLMITVEEKGRDLKKLVDEKVVPFFNKFFGVQLPTIQVGMQNISDGMGNAIVALDKIIDGDYQEIFTQRGGDLTFFALLGTKMAGLQKALRRSKSIKNKIAGYILDGLMIALGVNMVTRDEPITDENNALDMSDVATTAAITAGAAGAQFVAGQAYNKAFGAGASNAGKAAAIGAAAAGGAAGTSAGGSVPTTSSSTSRVSQFNMNAGQQRQLKTMGFRFDKNGTLLNPNGKGVASGKVLKDALNALGKPGLAAKVGLTGAKFALRYLPVIGWALIAYDTVRIANAFGYGPAQLLMNGEISEQQIQLNAENFDLSFGEKTPVDMGAGSSSLDGATIYNQAEEKAFNDMFGLNGSNSFNKMRSNMSSIMRKRMEMSSLSGNTGAQTVVNNYNTTQNMDQSQSVVLAQNDVPSTTDGVSLNNIGSVALLPA